MITSGCLSHLPHRQPLVKSINVRADPPSETTKTTDDDGASNNYITASTVTAKVTTPAMHHCKRLQQQKQLHICCGGIRPINDERLQ
eukprot:scaffold128621_cov20-Prasinocladus_malaysianus.AAC.2